MKRKKIAVIFGGCSGEHDVSLRSGESVMNALDTDKYQVIPVGITPAGTWIAGGDPLRILMEKKKIDDNMTRAAMVTDPENPGLLLWNQKNGKWNIKEYVSLDVVFPVLHGPYGEDGAVQGLLEMSGIPYVGSGILASATGMDKAVMKEIFISNDLPVGRFIYFQKKQWETEPEKYLIKASVVLKYPCFVKPANLGSSVGISKAANREQLVAAINEAFLYDEKVLLEAFIPGREIECSVLGDQVPEVSVPGEIIPCNEFYDYQAKYIDDRSELIIPAELSPAAEKEVRRLAEKVFLSIGASGMARVDFFVDNNKVTVNEINTIPGFTSISMYPKLWAASGLPYNELIDRLVMLATERFERRRSLINLPPGF